MKERNLDTGSPAKKTPLVNDTALANISTKPSNKGTGVAPITRAVKSIREFVDSNGVAPSEMTLPYVAPKPTGTPVANVTTSKETVGTGKSPLVNLANAIYDFIDAGETKPSTMTQPYVQQAPVAAPTNTTQMGTPLMDGTLLGDVFGGAFKESKLTSNMPTPGELEPTNWAGSPSSFQLQTQGVSIPEFAPIAETVFVKPYRQEVAPRISAAFLVASPTWREANQDVTKEWFGDFTTIGAAYQRALEDSRKAVDPNTSSDDFSAARIYSPGRSLTLLASDLVPGEQGTEKLNWEDGKEVDDYFRQGLPKFVSGAADFGFTWLDPWLAVGKASSVAKTKYITRPITPKNVKQISDEIQLAKETTEFVNSWSPILDAFEKAANPETFNPSELKDIPFLLSGSGANIIKTGIEAQIIGGRSLVGDVIQVAIDNGALNKIDEISAKSQTVGTQLQNLLEQEALLKNYVNDLLNPDIIAPPINSVDGLSKYASVIPPGIDTDLALGEEKLAKFLASGPVKELEDEIREKSDLAKLYLDMSGLAFTHLNQTVPVTALKKLSQRQVVAAQKADDTYWGFDKARNSSGGVTRAAYWVNPSARHWEAPRGAAQVSGPAGFRADREMAARIRELSDVVDMTPAQKRDLYNIGLMSGTKSEKYGFFDELLIRSQFDISMKHVPKLASLKPEQRAIFNRIFEHLNLQTTKKRGQVIKDATDKNYILTVDRQGTEIPQLKSLIEDTIIDYVNEISNGTRQVATQAEREYVINEIVKGTPTATSQVPVIHFAPSAHQIEDFVILHKAEINAIADNIINGTLTDDIIKEVLKEDSNFLNRAAISGIQNASGAELKTLAKDGIPSLMLAWQNNFWKPLTLLGFSYTSRNLLEGMSRVAMLFSEFHQERGYKYSDIFGDYTTLAIRTGNHKANKAAATKWRKELDEFNSKFDDLTASMSNEQKFAEDIFLNSQDSVALSMNDFNELRNLLSQFVTDSDEGIRFLNTIKRSADLAFKQGVPKDASKEFIEAITTGNYKRAWELSVSMNTEQLTTNLVYIKNEALGTLREVSYFIEKGNLPITARKIANELQISLSHISSSTDTAYNALLNRAKVRGTLDDYISRVSSNKPIKLRRGEGQFEPIPGSGYFVDDAFAENIGQIMRGQVSAAASTSSTVLNVRQQIAQTKWNMYVKEELIFPNEMLSGKPTSVVNRYWAEAFSDYMNNIYHNDALSQKILSIKPMKKESPDKFLTRVKEEVEQWLKSKESIEWKNELEYQKSRFPSRRDGKSKYLTIAEAKINEINNVLPLVGANGEDLSALRSKVINRTFTKADSLVIPEIDRMPIEGISLKVNNSDNNPAMRFWRSFVNSAFRVIGTIPEDNFVRFPFYRTVYRNEVRRRFNAIQAAGKSPAKYEAQVLEVARQEAYKQTMERLYSIERYTDFGQVVQFLSPFYMASQNSARFWGGIVTRKPATAINALRIWNIPNSMGIVYDEKGNRVAYDTPWLADDNEIQIGLPESVANYFGAKRYSTQKGMLDVSFQSRIPGIPSLGGSYVDAATVNFMRHISGTSLDPDRYAMKVGLGPNFIGEKVIPFYQSVKDNPNENFAMRTMRALVGYGSQWKPLLEIAKAEDGKANTAFKLRQESIYRSKVIDAEKEKKNLTADDHARLIEESASQTVKTFIAEFLLGIGPNPVKGKLKNQQQIEKDKVTSFIKQYGYEQGMIEYGKSLGKDYKYSAIPVLASANVMTDNIFGLYSNPQSIRNFTLNKELVTRVDSNNANSSVVGYLLNEGNPSDDYSVTSDNFLYTETVNNKNIKQNTNVISAYELQRRAFNNDYYPYSIAVDLMRKADAEAGREQDANFYQQLKDDKKAELFIKYPTYAVEPTYKTQEAVINDIRTMYAMTGDSNFMKTVGNRSKVVKAANNYLYNLRPTLVSLKESGLSTSEVDEIKLQFLNDYANGDAEVAKFLQIFFSRDDYTPIDINNVWKVK